jgi:hypothetical protein
VGQIQFSPVVDNIRPRSIYVSRYGGRTRSSGSAGNGARRLAPAEELVVDAVLYSMPEDSATPLPQTVSSVGEVRVIASPTDKSWYLVGPLKPRVRS